VSVSRTLQNVGGRPVEFRVKTRTSRRTVDLDGHTMRELDRWRRRLRRDGLPCGPDDWMFCNASGRFLNPDSVSQLFDRLLRRMGLTRIRFHDLRHAHASLLIAVGVPVKVVSERLGHSSRLHHAHLPTRPAGDERGRSRALRPPRGNGEPVDVYRLSRREHAGQRSRHQDPVDGAGDAPIERRRPRCADLGLHVVAGAGFEPATFGL
jgi:hypothetical protein